MLTVNVDLGDRSYPIAIGAGLFGDKAFAEHVDQASDDVPNGPEIIHGTRQLAGGGEMSRRVAGPGGGARAHPGSPGPFVARCHLS